MYATVRRYEGVKLPEDAVRKIKEDFVPMLQKLPGFVAYYWVDGGDGVLISTSVFESRESAEASNRKAVEWNRKNMASAIPSEPQITSGEVIVSSAAILAHH
jgi:hypothetical protein